MKNRKIEIQIEKRERIVFFQTSGEMRAVCPLCNAETVFLTPENAAALLGTTMRDIFRRIETGAIHFIEIEAGRQTLVCSFSLENLTGNQSLVAASDDKTKVVQ